MKTIVFLCVLLPLSLMSFAQEPPPPARLRSPSGTVVLRGTEDSAPSLNAAIPAEIAVVALPGARGVLEAKEGDVRLTLAGNLPGLSAGAALESEVVLHHAREHDLNVTLRRGRIILENKRDDGPIQVRIRVGTKNIDTKLLDAKSLVALEFTSRWPDSMPFLKQAKDGHEPLGELFLFVIRGKVEVEADGERSVPPGAMLYRWTSRTTAYAVAPLKKTPDWLSPGQDKSTVAKSLHDGVEKVRLSIADKGVKSGIAAARQAPAPATRLAAMLSHIALSEAPPVFALEDSSPLVRAGVIEGVLNFIGRSPKNDIAFHQSLLANKWKAGQADIAMELLHGLSPQELARQETIETLVDYLQSDRVAIRELARWTLVRLAPEGNKIDYDATSDAAARARAQEAWRKLIAMRSPTKG